MGKSKLKRVRKKRRSLRSRFQRKFDRILDFLWLVWLRLRHYGDIRELYWDHRLGIKTTGRDDRHAGKNRHSYEPTPYRVLERIKDSGYISNGDVLLDYGCGKGRVDFFLTESCGIKSIGIEYDKDILKRAMKNRQSFYKKEKSGNINQRHGENRGEQIGKIQVDLILKDALFYEVPDDVNRIFFFNPFSGEILKKVLEKIMASYDRNPRQIVMFFYYPILEYMEILLSHERIGLIGEIETKDMYDARDSQECVMLFQIENNEDMAS